MAIVIRNAMKFERSKEIYDKEQRNVVVKGKIEGQMVTGHIK